MTITTILALIALSVPTPLAQASAPDVHVRVHAISEVSGERFTLKEIADVTGADRAYAAEVAAIEVGTSPLPGQSRQVLIGDILVRIRFNHLDPDRIKLTVPPTVRISRAGVAIPVADMVRAAADKLTEERRHFNDGATIEPIQLPATGFSAAGKRAYQASVARGNLEAGPVYMLVTVLVEGSPVRTVEIPFRVKRSVQVLLASRPLSPHTLLTAADVTLGTVDIAQLTGTPVASLEHAAGKRTSRLLAQGAPITDACLELTPIIAPGAEVTLELVSGVIHVRMSAIARAAGCVGQTIRVTAETHKDFEAVVVDGKTVRLEENP